jgi:hypothetical protein
MTLHRSLPLLLGKLADLFGMKSAFLVVSLPHSKIAAPCILSIQETLCDAA